MTVTWLPGVAVAAPAKPADFPLAPGLPTDCSDNLIIGVRGSGQVDGQGAYGMGGTVDPYYGLVRVYLRGFNPNLNTQFYSLYYPATAISDLGNFSASVQTGVENLVHSIQYLASKCPAEKFGLIGYSQGAMVIHNTVNVLGGYDLGHVRAVLLLSDPLGQYTPNVSLPVLDGAGVPRPQLGGILGRNGLTPDIRDRATELCILNDPVCDSPQVLFGKLLQGAFNSGVHGRYPDCCGSTDWVDFTSEQVAGRMMTAISYPNPPQGSPVPPGGPPPDVTSVYGLADGTVLWTRDSQRVYKMVGGAPVWVSSCATNLCPNPLPTKQSVIDAGPATPANGATAKDEAGNIFKFAGGAPIHLASCAVGCGNPVAITAWSIVNNEHMRSRPADGTTIQDEPGDIFKFAGGAPLHLASCAVDCGNPVHVSGASIVQLDHMNPVPVDGTTIVDEPGDIFKIVGGAPIHLASCAVGCGSPVRVSSTVISQFDHLARIPQDGVTIVDEPGDIFKFVGGAPIHLASCAVDCGQPLGISGASIIGLDHMNPVPADGATVIDEPGDVFRFAGGAPIHLSACDLGCQSWVRISGASIIGTEHMRSVPADGTTVRTETGAIYKIVGGSPLWLSDCNADCGNPVSITQWSVDSRDHMNAVPADGTKVVAVEGGTIYQVSGGEADLLDTCNGSGNCTGLNVVNQSSIDPIAQSVANHGPGYGELARYSNGADHYSAVGSVPAGYRFELPLGLLDRVQDPGTVALMACMSGSDEFLSTDPNCEGQAKVAALGYLYQTPPASQPALPLYRCQVTGTGEHFDSTTSDCEGQRVEHLLGYTIGYATFTRYNNGADHWSTVGGLPAGYRPEWTFGMLSQVALPDTRLLTSCMMGGDEFSSLDPNCEGQAKVAPLGWIWTNPPAGKQSIAIYRCRQNPSGEHFDSFDPNCEGQLVEAQLGYLLARTVLSRTNRGDGHHSTNGGGLPSGYRFEGAFGYLSWNAEPGTKPLTSCRYNGGEFDSLDPNCEGRQVNGLLGNIWQQPPAGVPSTQIFRCSVPNGDHFDSVDPNCEGSHLDGALGYLLLRP
ncbi:cutinase family protein [Amycolatopsis sp. NBC_01488]|uniref:cutinase family protein n=1 Tax=Amycolatopsis sp. NBC_01488 TaxID=2903563 RepID=UPI002E2DDCA1|nr:cutinase family protein [Amycolatopsis sp. NBC_01488]